MNKESGKIKISVKKSNSATSKSRGGVMDFRPSRNSQPRKVPKRLTEEELSRKEIARQQVSRREEIHRQIEAQNEADIIAHRRAEAARKELARQRAVEQEAARARAEKEAERAEAVRLEREKARQKQRMEQEVAAERRKIIAARRAAAARKELARRQAADASLKRAAVRHVNNPSGSVDPLARATANSPRHNPTVKHIPTPESSREVTVKTSRMTRAEKEYRALHPEALGDVDDFAIEVEEFDEENITEEELDETVEKLLDSLDDEPVDPEPTPEADKKRNSRKPNEDLFSDDDLAGDLLSSDDFLSDDKKDEDTSANNSSYVLGGTSPFINTDRIIKRPLSGSTGGIGADQLQRPGYRYGKQLLGGPNQGDYVSPTEYDSPYNSNYNTAHETPAAKPATRPAAHSSSSNSTAHRTSAAHAASTSVSGNRYVPYEEPIPHKNLYARRVAAAKKEKADIPTMVVDERSDRGSGLAMAGIILLTVILGSGVGIIVYFAFFQ